MPETYGPYSPELPRDEYTENVNSFEEVYNNPELTHDAENKAAALKWEDSTIDVESILNNSHQPIVEVAGPTMSGFELLHGDKLRNPVYTSNVHNGLYILKYEDDDDDEGAFEKIADVDFIADGKDIPIKNEGAAALFASCVPGRDHTGDRGLRSQVISEALRVVEPGGFLVWQGGKKEDLEKAISLGFRPVRVIYHPGRNIETEEAVDTRGDVWNAIFQKPLVETEE